MMCVIRIGWKQPLRCGQTSGRLFHHPVPGSNAHKTTMNVMSRSERLWKQFPCLGGLVGDASVPRTFYHNGGMMSPYTTVFDDLHDFGEISAIVGASKESIIAAFEKAAATLSPQDRIDQAERLLRELEHLRDIMRFLFETFSRERTREIQDIQGAIHALREKEWHGLASQEDERGNASR